MTTPDPRLLVARTTFFEILDEVLASFGREKLTEPYRSVIAVEPSERVLQLLAGPGSGKTETLAWRALYELFVLGTEATRIVVTTFTRRAATELQIRVVERSDEFLRLAHARGLPTPDPKVHDLRIGTVHSLCDSLLVEFDDTYVEAGTELVDEAEASIRLARSYRYKLGFNNPPNPPRVINRLLARAELVSIFRPPWGDVNSWPLRTMEVVSFLRDVVAQHVETWIPRCFESYRQNGIEKVHKGEGVTEDLCKLQQRWEQYLDENQILDFTTVQKRFLERQDILLNHFDHIFVDEFQDSNPIQFAIHTRWLHKPDTRLTVVGDDDQAIYRFRGSDIDCFRGLEPFCESHAVKYRPGR